MRIDRYGQASPAPDHSPGGPSRPVDAGDVGGRVAVKGYTCAGTLRFFGPHAVGGKPRCGVELDEPVGNNNGTINGHLYFTAGEGFGVLVKPAKVTRADSMVLDLGVSPTYGNSSQFRGGSSKSGGSSSVVHEVVGSADAMYTGAENGLGDRGEVQYATAPGLGPGAAGYGALDPDQLSPVTRQMMREHGEASKASSNTYAVLHGNAIGGAGGNNDAPVYDLAQAASGEMVYSTVDAGTTFQVPIETGHYSSVNKGRKKAADDDMYSSSA